MRKLLAADSKRMIRSRWFWLCMAGMLSMAGVFVVMQHTAMDYTVPLSRVIFLPMSFFGLFAAAFVSLFVGEDFGDGFIRNKVIAGLSRYSIFVSSLLVSSCACIVIYLVVTVFTAGIGSLLFEINIDAPQFFTHLLLGMGMCIAYASIYCSITVLCGNRTTSVVLCMGIAFTLLCACLHTNQVMIQPEYKDGLPNPAYVDGIRKAIYALLHDLNPSGQAAQLSAMVIFSPARWFACDLSWVLAAGICSAIFQHRNIQ